MDNLGSIVKLLSSLPWVLSIALGGSRSRGQGKPDSDYDIFVIIDNDPKSLLGKFADVFRSLSNNILFFGKDKYLEDWGYMFCGIDTAGNFYDIAVIQQSRVSEMCIRSTNVILYDPNGIFKNAQLIARDIDYQSPEYLSGKVTEVNQMMYLNYFRFLKFYKASDYWMAIRFLNLMRENVFKLYRIRTNTPSKLFFLPDEKFKEETGNDFSDMFIVDGSLNGLYTSARKLVGLFLELNNFPDQTIIHLHHIFSIDYDQ